MLAQQEGFIRKNPVLATLGSYGSARLQHDSCRTRDVCWHTFEVAGAMFHNIWKRKQFQHSSGSGLLSITRQVYIIRQLSLQFEPQS
eukprot:8506640-Ditylum_brightwellii.AAC.1